MTYQYIRYEREDSLAVLTFNRPEVRNALSYASIDEALDAVAQFEADDAARVLILTGAGEQAFIAGADIKELQARDVLTEMGERSGRRRVLTGKLESMPKPSIAAINGFATGGGLEMALACTLRIAAETARLGLPEINLGIIPGNGGTQRLPRLIGKGRAMEMILTGDVIDAQEAYRIGLVNKVAPQGQVMEVAKDLARKLAQKAPLALRAAKEAVNASGSLGLADGLAHEARLFAILCGTEDKREGVAAFLEKRSAAFQGR